MRAGRRVSKMVPTTTLDDWLLPRLKLRRDDAFDAHIKVHPAFVRHPGITYASNSWLLSADGLVDVVCWQSTSQQYSPDGSNPVGYINMTRAQS